MIDPLACPFCGSRNVAHGLFGGDMIVKCIDCFSGGPPVDAPEFSDMVEKRKQAVAAWNHRSALAPQAGDNAEEPVGYVEERGLRKLRGRSPTAIYPEKDEWFNIPLYTHPCALKDSGNVGDGGAGTKTDLLIAKNALTNEARRAGPLTVGEIEAVFARLSRTVSSHPCTSTPVVSQNAPALEDKGGGVLDQPARVGNVVFRKGISVATVIKAAQRNYEQRLPVEVSDGMVMAANSSIGHTMSNYIVKEMLNAALRHNTAQEGED